MSSRVQPLPLPVPNPRQRRRASDGGGPVTNLAHRRGTLTTGSFTGALNLLAGLDRPPIDDEFDTDDEAEAQAAREAAAPAPTDPAAAAKALVEIAHKPPGGAADASSSEALLRAWSAEAMPNGVDQEAMFAILGVAFDQLREEHKHHKQEENTQKVGGAWVKV